VLKGTNNYWSKLPTPNKEILTINEKNLYIFEGASNKAVVVNGSPRGQPLTAFSKELILGLTHSEDHSVSDINVNPL